MIRRMLFITSIVFFMLLLAACQPAVNESNGTAGNQPGDITAEAPGNGQVATSECADIDAETLRQAGNDVYSTRCASCHGAQGEGNGTFPGLMNNENLNAADAVTTLQTFFNQEIHPFIDDITNMDVAAVLSYVRNTFGNEAPVICPEDVEAIRPAP